MKIIINNTSNRTDLEAIRLVHSVIQGGLVSDSGKAYCYVSTFTNSTTGAKSSVHAKRNSETSHTFTVLGEK